MESEDAQFYAIAKEITSIFGKIFASRPYIAIVDATGKIHFIDSLLADQHLEFIESFVRTNFNLLKVGEYSFPLGGINLAFFKLSPKAMIAIFTTKGFTGQLLAFKTRMHEWTNKIDDVIGEIVLPLIAEEPEIVEPITPVIEKKSKGFKKIPILARKLTGKEKFSIDVASILQFCDGKHSIEEICEETKYAIIKVNAILKEYQNKNWIRYKKIIT